jgi:hypothetical protein
MIDIILFNSSALSQKENQNRDNTKSSDKEHSIPCDPRIAKLKVIVGENAVPVAVSTRRIRIYFPVDF